MTKKIVHASRLALGILMLLCSLPLTAQENSSKPTVNQAVASGISVPLRTLATLPATPRYGFHEANPVRRLPKRPAASVVDPVEQNVAESSSNYPIGVNVLGVGNGFPNYGVPDAPPDTNMAVGDTQLLQWVNVSYAVFDKNGKALTGAIDGNMLWASGLPGTLCARHNDSDPIAQWDRIAHRWLLFQNVLFEAPYAVCVAVSTSSDALGTYYVYQFGVPGNGLPDYPKWGIWPAGYFQAQNNFGTSGSKFQGAQVCAYNRAKLLVGDSTAEQQCFQLTSGEDSLLPGDLDSPTSPPTGQDEFYIGSLGDVDTSHLSVYSFHVDFANPANSFITGSGNSQLVSIATFTPACNGNFGGDCVPQKGVSDLLDSLGDRLMYRFAYYNDGVSLPSPMQHWYVNFNVTASGGQNGVRWMEFTAPTTVVSPLGIAIFQQGTYAPDANWRWMASVARDQKDDVLLGYSESSTNMYPSIFIAGRTPLDAAGTLETEVSIVNGTGSQPDTGNRWGDYSAMRIDPVDNCTFWYTTEYYTVTQSFDWSTQIASASFPGCSQSDAFVPATPCRLVDTRPEYGGAGPIPGGTFKTFYLPQIAPSRGCTDLTLATAYSLNVTVVPNGPLGYLTLWPTGEKQPLVSTLNSYDGRVKANAAIVVAGSNGGVNVFVTDTSNVILDIDGYFAPLSGSTLAFYSLAPCRVADTRNPVGDLGGPYLKGGKPRDFPVLESMCSGLPTDGSAQAYSLNFTVVPHGPLGYLTVWPTGQTQPLVSTLNAYGGQVTANAAIVPAGTSGKVSTYATNDTDLVIDINGYFAPPGQNGLFLYSLAPCRVLDTRPPLGNGAFNGTLSPPVDVVKSPCGVPSTSQAYVFNATVVPSGALGYLTLWPDGMGQPVVSTLNALDGAVTSNMAIVPAGTAGKIDAYADGLTELILDISSYFAP